MIVNEKNPFPTPPHKGEGLNLRPSQRSFLNTERKAGSSPSPLWGGVGEGFSP
ncbi:hypothetical protein GGE46_005079 [Rhizobium etli]|uniref:Uncharacterized protein n=1 Tax=Rhizobium etli TaxID=29449 RepID=A0A7W7EI31_RHIET|nr:hypothetical protein [Rhizobium etli]MBB4538295.1 hypothetical protein [Rhizobium etli]